jgi:site-specific DNA-methyltransferase (adenine-specific)
MALMARYPDKYFSLAVVDPPYGLGEKLTSGGTWSVKWQDKGAEWDKAPEKFYFDELIRVSTEWIIFGGNYFIQHLPNCRHFIAWHKPYMDGMHSMSNVELALCSHDRNAKKVSFNKDSGDRLHVCQKPVKLYDWIFKNYAKEGDKILDTHLGSGSSRISAWKAGLDFTACELDADYFAAQEKRFKEFTAQLRLF